MVGSNLNSILKYKCPHCHEGDFFQDSAFKGKMNSECKKCQRSLIREPGFYQGSNYVNYALGVAVFVISWGVVAMLSKGSFEDVLKMLLYVAPISLICATPFIYPLSKIIWANMFYHYKGIGADEK